MKNFVQWISSHRQLFLVFLKWTQTAHFRLTQEMYQSFYFSPKILSLRGPSTRNLWDRSGFVPTKPPQEPILNTKDVPNRPASPQAEQQTSRPEIGRQASGSGPDRCLLSAAWGSADCLVFGSISYLMQCNLAHRINHTDDTVLDLKDERELLQSSCTVYLRAVDARGLLKSKVFATKPIFQELGRGEQRHMLFSSKENHSGTGGVLLCLRVLHRCEV